jgi:hypothetical protein
MTSSCAVASPALQAISRSVICAGVLFGCGCGEAFSISESKSAIGGGDGDYSDSFWGDCIFYSHLSRYSMDRKRSNSTDLGATMGNKNSKRLVICATLGLLLFGGLSATALAEPHDFHFTINVNHLIEVHYADGRIVLAEVLAEINLNADGRANGALGLREPGPRNPLTAYRVFAGQVSDDNAYLFNAQRLSPPEGPVTITLRRLDNPRSRAGYVGVTFEVALDDPTGVGSLNFVTQAQVLSKPTDLPSVTDILIDRFAYVNAPPQTVVVQTSRGSYRQLYERRVDLSEHRRDGLAGTGRA